MREYYNEGFACSEKIRDFKTILQLVLSKYGGLESAKGGCEVRSSRLFDILLRQNYPGVNLRRVSIKDPNTRHAYIIMQAQDQLYLIDSTVLQFFDSRFHDKIVHEFSDKFVNITFIGTYNELKEIFIKSRKYLKAGEYRESEERAHEYFKAYYKVTQS